MHSVYILHSAKDSNLYIGYTTNIAQRFQAHNTGSVLSTKARRPLKIIFIETFTHKFDALRRERYFKTNEGKKMLKRILRETLAGLAVSNIDVAEENVDINEEIEQYRLQWKAARETAEELVRARGWSEQDDDFGLQIEEETKRQWEEQYIRH